MQWRLISMLVCAGGVGCGSVKDQPLADAPVFSDAPGPDGGAAACGDGVRDPGEVCYGTPITITANDVAMDGHLADVDGDGDLDLVYLIGDQFVFHLQDGGQFAAAGLDGPTVFSSRALSANLDGDAEVELVNAGANQLETYDRKADGTYAVTGQIGTMVPIVALALANVTGGVRPNPVGLYPNTIIVGVYDASLRLTQANGRALMGGRDLVAGKVDEDAFADVVVAAANGVLLFRGGANGLGAITNTPRNMATDGIAIGDVDGDGKVDLLFDVQGATGRLGVLKSVGGGAFLAEQTVDVGDAGVLLEAADVDGDGRADAIATRVAVGSNAVLVALGKADGTLAEPVALPIAIAPDYLRADADFNRDGVPDIVVTNINTQTIVIVPSDP